MAQRPADHEAARLREEAVRKKNWKRWGPYLSERQWGTVREDYSPDGSCWTYFPHDHARSRAYRWGEDGLLGICDRECRLCFALALWNGRDPILKERLFGLANQEGNHGEDVKELYFYLDSTPTHSYMKALYKYPQAEFPYARLVEENRRRGKDDAEFELLDTGVFDEGRYFDVFAEYAKAGPDDLCIRITVANRGPDAAELWLLPTLWFRNSWVWGCTHEGCHLKSRISQDGPHAVVADHMTLGKFRLAAEEAGADNAQAHGPQWLFADNETNARRLYGVDNATRYVKDGFHEYLVHGRTDAIDPRGFGTKAAPLYHLRLAAGAQTTVRLRLHSQESPHAKPFGADFDRTFAKRIAEADAFYDARMPAGLDDEQRRVMRQTYAGLLWSKQFYHYAVEDWLDGDPHQPPPPRHRRDGRNADWRHLFNRDVVSMPDKWEYPWFAAWDLAFHMIPFAHIDPHFAKEQLILMLREWYMHPNGQLPAYEFNFSDVNPPVHAWACWRVYKIAAASGLQDTPGRDKLFLRRAFQKLLLNFTWWVNRKDVSGRHIFSGGFLGMDNVGLFDRNAPLPSGTHLEQADGTAWMAFYCGTMLSMALELARDDPSYEDVASKFFEHFVAITDAMNTLGGTGLWNEEDGFYYDQIFADKKACPLRARSMVGIVPLFACEVLDGWLIEKLPGFEKRMRWFLQHRGDLARHISYMARAQKDGEGQATQPQPRTPVPSDCGAGVSPAHAGETPAPQFGRASIPVPDERPGACLASSSPADRAKAEHSHYLLAIPSRDRLVRMLRYILDENEFLSPHGVRSVSRIHRLRPVVCNVGGQDYCIDYVPGDSATSMFGGNSNWRGPIWFPVNFLLIESLQRYHHFYGDSLKVECPTGSGRMMNLQEVASELESRLTRLFLPDNAGRRPCNGDDAHFDDPHFRELVLFHEFFHGDTGKGLGASHQTGWTGLVARLLRDVGKRNDRETARASAEGTSGLSDEERMATETQRHRGGLDARAV